MSQDGKPDSNARAQRLLLSRRGVLAGAPLAALAGACTPPSAQLDARAPLAPPASGRAPSRFDLTRSSSALAPDETVNSACQFCNSLCGIKVHKKSGRVIDIQGEPADPVQAGNLCVKAGMMRELLYNRHRVTHPMKRVSGQKGDPASKFEPVSWDVALSDIAKKLLALRDAGAAETVANKTSGRMVRGAGSIIGRFIDLYGSPNATDVGPVCNDAGGNALSWTFGLGNFTNGYGVDGSTGKEDLGAARYFLMLGTNQAETHPVTFEYLLRARAQTGAKLVVVDPRRTPTGAQAHHRKDRRRVGDHVAMRRGPWSAGLRAAVAHLTAWPRQCPALFGPPAQAWSTSRKKALTHSLAWAQRSYPGLHRLEDLLAVDLRGDGSRAVQRVRERHR
jgi:anaerobic selenocysteine-containing dehydrogenase